jgi:hypothetical protein
MRLSSQNPPKLNKLKDIYVPFSFIGLGKIETVAKGWGKIRVRPPSCANLSESCISIACARSVYLKLAEKARIFRKTEIHSSNC